MTTKHPLTEAEMRARIEDIALQAFVDSSADIEPLEQLIARVRSGVLAERLQMNATLMALEAELDEFSSVINLPSTTETNTR